MFRLPRDRALVNRLGFNNEGATAAARGLAHRPPGTVGFNIGKTKRVGEVDRPTIDERLDRLGSGDVLVLAGGDGYGCGRSVRCGRTSNRRREIATGPSGTL